ncbi:Asp/Glu/hydantoin racemase [Agrobacterium larrymoorei]|uniref:Asp/Glu/hydantoin racemase n=1 Tax=Agrobacterium larrymoorei TaxID=160699 RepID=A0AAJ2EPR4_9HYPH|nr:aspartate/glutamate racemase family protein [Agrobacterium larrymoorei]MDR6100450.1 Asp/Glu/hydantoin racemase [Agrobacterium larrymoorei]
MKEIVKAQTEGFDTRISACLDETGLDAACTMAAKPVTAIVEASFHAASLVAHSFCVVTTLSRLASVIEDNIRRYGFANRFRCGYAINIPALALETGAFEKI